MDDFHQVPTNCGFWDWESVTNPAVPLEIEYRGSREEILPCVEAMDAAVIDWWSFFVRFFNITLLLENERSPDMNFRNLNDRIRQCMRGLVVTIRALACYNG